MNISPQQFTQAVRATVIANKSYNKIFCVGTNKTGTTSVERALRLYGFNLPHQHEQEMRLTKQCFRTDYTEFKRFVENYDAFQDLPFADGETYVAADALFPNSKFILTERSSEAWYKSPTSFYKKIFKLDTLDGLSEEDVRVKFPYLYKEYLYELFKHRVTSYEGNKANVNWDKLFDKKFLTEVYEARNHRIKKYFHNSEDKLLIIDITKEKTTEKICAFLNIPPEFAIDMPHANKT